MSNLADFVFPAGLRYITKTANYAFTIADCATVINCTGTWTLTAPTISSLGDEFFMYLRNTGTGVITGPTADGTAISLQPGDIGLLGSDGSALYFMELRKGGWTLIQTNTTTTGTTSSFLSIPKIYSQLLFEFNGVSHDSGSNQWVGIEVSTDNTNFSTPVDMSNGITATSSQTLQGSTLISGNTNDFSVASSGIVAGNLLTSPGGASITGAILSFRHTGGLSAVRFSWMSGASFDAGTIKLWAKG